MNVLLMLLQYLHLLLICLKEYAQVDTIQHNNQVHTNGVCDSVRSSVNNLMRF